jgi:hypothetical protein
MLAKFVSPHDSVDAISEIIASITTGVLLDLLTSTSLPSTGPWQDTLEFCSRISISRTAVKCASIFI